MGDDAAPLHERVGLCARCGRARRLESAKGSTFWRCEFAKRDPRFRAYPELPVHACTAFQSLRGSGSE